MAWGSGSITEAGAIDLVQQRGAERRSGSLDASARNQTTTDDRQDSQAPGLVAPAVGNSAVRRGDRLPRLPAPTVAHLRPEPVPDSPQISASLLAHRRACVIWHGRAR